MIIKELKQWQTNSITTKNVDLKKKKKKKRQQVPSSVRYIVWNAHIGIENGLGKCYCCKIQQISQQNFHCGHVISDKNGGTISIENLRPICGNCNSSMGTKNMSEFMKKFGIIEEDDKFDTNISDKVINAKNEQIIDDKKEMQ